MVSSVGNVGKQGMDFITKMVTSNRRFIEGFLIFFIVLEFLPRNLFGMNLKSNVKGVVKPVTDLFQNDIFSFALLLVLLWSCCVKKDLEMFMLVVLFLLTHNVHSL